MKNFLFLLAFLTIPIFVSAQETKGVSGAGTLKLSRGRGMVHAVVVGISDYQNDGIPDLRFADRDALSFVDYLKSNSGGNLTDDQLIVLTNKEATTAKIAAAMDWLIEVTDEGGKAIIYFSGHGDVETKTAMQHGFLLTYDSPPTTYIAGAYPLFYLQSVISTLSQEKKAQVVMMMDACHAGKLAGSAIGGTQATSAALSKQFANEIKIMSCQPDEFSMEGEQWGGGRGAFSFHLIDGLVGLADKNGDFQVSLLELERYLEETVPAEVAPGSQIPMTVGNKGNIIAFVDEAELAKLKALKEAGSPMLAMADSRGIEEDVLAKADSQTVRQYRDFKKALKSGPLMSDDLQEISGEKPPLSADQFYGILSKKEVLKPLYGPMRRHLAVALQEEAQQSINTYLNTREGQIASGSINEHEEIKRNRKYAMYLSRAAALLSQKHYMFPDLKSRELYFAAKADFLTANMNYSHRDSFLRSALHKLEEGLKLQERAPHILVEIGKIYSALKQYQKAIAHYDQAVELSPMWPIPYFTLAVDFTNLGDFEKAVEYAQKALALQPRYENAFGALTYAYYMLEEYDSIIILCEQTIDKMPEYLAAYLELSLAYLEHERIEDAEQILLKAQNLAPRKALVYSYLGEVYMEQEKYEPAEKALKKAIGLDALDRYPYQVLAHLYILQNQMQKAEEVFKKVLEFNPGSDLALGQLGLVCLQNKQYERAWELFEKASIIAPEFSLNQFNFFCYYYQTGREEEAFQWLEKAFENGLSDYLEHREVTFTDCFKEVMNTKRFAELKSKYEN